MAASKITKEQCDSYLRSMCMFSVQIATLLQQEKPDWNQIYDQWLYVEADFQRIDKFIDQEMKAQEN